MAVITAVVAYVVSPVEAIAARVIRVESVVAGHERIEGRALEDGRPASGISVSIYRFVRGRRILVGSPEVNAAGRFSVREPPGRYFVVVRHHGSTARVAVTLARGQIIFIAIVIKHGGGFLGAPTIFNY